MKAKTKLFWFVLWMLLSLYGSAWAVEDMISHWRFDEGGGTIAYDSVGTNDGTIYGAAWTTGQVGSALSFDGVDDYVALPDNEPVWLPQYNFTLSAWVYFERSSGSVVEKILDLNSSSSANPDYDQGYGVSRYSTGKIGFGMNTTSTPDEGLLTDDMFFDGKWYHIVAVRDGTTQAIYVDGQLNVSRTCSPDPIDFVSGYDDDRVNIGRLTTNVGTPRLHLKGKIDDVRIYDRALSAAEILVLYQQGSGPVAHWKFDEGGGTTAYDSFGDNHGIIYGAQWTTGQISGALSFDGVDDYIDCGNDSSLMTTGDLSISAWIKASKNRACIYSHTWAGWRLGFGIGNNDYDGRLGFYTRSHGQWIEAGNSLADNAWHHVAVTLNGNMVRLYTDGFEIGHGIGAPASDLTRNANIGIYNYTWHFGGIIDDVRIYDRALSEEEIQELYAPYFPGENLVVNGGFDTTEITSGGWPSTYGDWSGDHSYIFARYGDVWPFQGSQMLQFVGSSHYGAGGSEESCQVYQIIDVSQYADIIAAGRGIVLASAYFNRAEGDAQTDTEFVLTVHAHEGDPCSFIPWELVLDWVETSVYTDSNPATWEQGETQLVLPTNTDYVVIGIIAMENIYNDFSWPEFDGHFADAVSLRIMVEPKVPERVYYVDGINGDDNNDGLSPETAFATIQKGIDTATDGNTVIVYPAVYTEPIDFSSKAITLQGVPSPAGTPILEAPGGFAVSFSYGEEPNSVLKNFVIRNSNIGVFIADASPTISNVTVVNNVKGIAAYGYCEPDISSSIFWYNSEIDLYLCEARYTFTQDVNEPNRPLEGLISHWRFDEGSGTTAYDWFGGNDGTVHGAVWTSGQVDGALSFDGVDDYVEVPDDDSLNPSNQITISFWIYNRGGKQAGIYKYAGCPGEPHSPGNSTAYFMCVRDDSGKAQLRIHSSTLIYDNILSSNAVPLNEWYYIAGTFNQGNAAVYIDGQLDNSDIMSVSSIMNDVQPLMIGGFWYYCGTDTFRSTNGIIDDVRIYDRALSAEEILQVYQNGVLAGPLFADPYNGDYHLLSERGRYWPQHDVWVLDEVSSPCLDGGDPMVGPSNEPMPNGGRINQGVYGGTAYASMSEWPITSDINRDGRVDFRDVALLCNDWLSKLPWIE